MTIVAKLSPSLQLADPVPVANLTKHMKTRNVTFSRRNCATITLRCHIAMLPTLHGQHRGRANN